MKPEDKYIINLVDSLEPLSLPLGKNIELDLGCGKGSFSTELAKKYPESLIISTDVMIGRLRKLYKRNQRNNLSNIIPIRGEAWFLIKQRIIDAQVARIHILCPDPWPKDKQKGFRLISSEFVALLHRKLKKNGIFHFSTDDIDYFSATLEIMSNSKLFKNNNSGISDIQGIKTDFEKRWTEMGLEVHHTAWMKT